MDLIEIIGCMLAGVLLALVVITGITAYDEHSFKSGD